MHLLCTILTQSCSKFYQFYQFYQMYRLEIVKENYIKIAYQYRLVKININLIKCFICFIMLKFMVDRDFR